MQTNVDSEIILSVIIPTCNRNDTLTRAIYSVLNQNISSFEIVVVNDSDNSINDELLATFESYPVSFVSNHCSHGAASARNFGVSIAKGKYITFLDDDDIYLAGRLKNMLSVIEKGEYILVSSGRFYETGDFKSVRTLVKQHFGEISLAKILYRNDIDIGFMIKKVDFINFDGFNTEMKSLEDWDFILRVLERGCCYKLERLDYVVNLDPDRSRVSDSESDSYLQIAEMYRNKYGDVWSSYMIANGLSLSGKLKLIFVFKELFLKFRYLPVLCYLKQIKRKLLS